MSRPLTRIVGELTNRSARACSTDRTSILRRSTRAPVASRTAPTASSAVSILASLPEQRSQADRSRNRKSITTVRRTSEAVGAASTVLIMLLSVARSAGLSL
jgi:hypothetical protein